MERTLILVKPDAFARALSGEIIARFERKGLRIVALRHMTVTRELAEQHYAEHAERPFFGELVDFITSGPIVAMVLEGQRGGQGRAPGDRRDEPARGGAGQHPRRLRDRDRRRTWCTARTRRSRRRARARCSSASSSPPGRARCRCVLASRSPQRREILERLRPRLQREGLGRARARATGEPAAVALENALRKARAVRRPRRGTRSCSAATRSSSLDGRIYGKPADEREAARDDPRARPGARTR